MAESKLSGAMKWLDTHVADMIELQRGLTARAATCPTSGGAGESEKAAFLTEYLEERGFPVLARWDAEDSRVPSGVRPNFAVGTDGASPERKIWLMSHLDVVPPGEQDGKGGWKGWSGDPYALRVTEDRVIGRGVEDNQLAIVSGVFALLALKELDIQPGHPVRLLFVSDEETGSNYGLGHVIRTATESFSEDDLIVVPDAGNEDGSMMEIAEKSILWLKFTIRGRQCHASRPHLGVNAFRAASHLVVRLEELSKDYGESDPLFDPPTSTFEPTRRESNVPNVNTVPGVDVFCFDCRLLPTVDLDGLIERVESICRDVCGKFGAEYDIEIIQRADATQPTSKEAPVVKALQAAIKDVMGIDADPGGIGGGTVAAVFRRAGYPAAVWLKTEECAHQPDEYCPLSNMVDNAKVFARLFTGP